MKIKKLISIAVVLCLAFALAVPALAQDAERPREGDNSIWKDEYDEDNNPNPDWYKAPGSPYNDPTDATWGTQSRGFASARSDDTSSWNVSGDDTDITGRDVDMSTEGVDIAVWARITEISADTLIYCVDIEWGNMKFVFGKSAGGWNPDTHEYELPSGTGDDASWWIADTVTGEGYLDGQNNQIIVTNRSNNGITADFDFTFEGGTDNLFNVTATTDDRVIPGFYADNDDAKLGALLLTDADIAAGNDDNGDIPHEDLQLGEGGPDILMLASAVGTDPDATSGDHIGEVYFAFSGTPDDDAKTRLPDFKKVGVITVTIIPSNVIEINRVVASDDGTKIAITFTKELNAVSVAALNTGDFTITGVTATGFAVDTNNEFTLVISLNGSLAKDSNVTVAFTATGGANIIADDGSEIVSFSPRKVDTRSITP